MQARHWCFTINNPGDELIDFDVIEHVRYSVYQKEVGEQGTPHYQGYIEFTKPKRLGAVKKIFPTAHWEVRKGTRTEARDYCTKEDSRVDGPYEYGEWRDESPKKGRAIDSFKEAIDSGKTDLELWDSHPFQFLQYHKHLGTIRLLKSSGRNWEMTVEYIYGKPGVGKSHKALTENPGAFWKAPLNQWWDGYQGQKTIILDEFSGRWFPWEILMKLLDCYPLPVEQKGGMMPMMANKIVITSNKYPWDLYNRLKFPMEALYRRITSWILLEEGVDPIIPLETKVANIWSFYPLATGLSYEDFMNNRNDQFTGISS